MLPAKGSSPYGKAEPYRTGGRQSRGIATPEKPMYTNVNLAAPLGVLAFLGTGFLLLVTVLLLIYSLTVKKFGLAKIVVMTMVAVAGIYLAAVLAFSFASSEKCWRAARKSTSARSIVTWRIPSPRPGR